jgi:pyrroline-5-carboxylate reductase
MHQQPLAFVGGGAMGEAMLSGVLQHNLLPASHITVAEPRESRRHELESRYHVATSDDTLAVVRSAKTVILAVKPQVLPSLLPSLRGTLATDALCISIAAGVQLHTFHDGLNHPLVIRAMPNTPSQIGEGMTVWVPSPDVTAEQRAWAKALFGAFGKEQIVEQEAYLDMATAISGSGPAYVFLILESMIDAGVHLGFSRDVAEQLVFQTVRGAVEYAAQSDAHLAQLRNAVTSPGGTTAAGLHALMQGGLPSVLSDGIWAAYQRSQALGRKE